MTKTPISPRLFAAASALALGVFALSGCSMAGGDTDKTTSATEGGSNDTHETTVETQDSDVFELKVGDCVASDTGSQTQVTSIPTVDCSQPHAFEVYADQDIAGSTFPGTDAVATESDQICVDAFEAFMGAPYDSTTEYGITYLNPTEQSWKSGDRAVSCMVGQVDSSGNPVEVTGTLQGAAK